MTRRLNPVAVGKLIAVCPGRGKKAIAHVRVISCINSLQHYEKDCVEESENIVRWKSHEAALEGFKTWDGLCRWLADHKIQFIETFRIEFELL